ncbi:hypothetical protein HZ994_15395 [Akkermansiaceae bacterium]|nr:hypothetical protein HZ994_15395 [Akkermansiaceae bacterium]
MSGKSLKLHLLWGLAAIGAYALGSVIASRPAESSAAVGRETGDGTRATNGGLSRPDGNESATRRTRSQRDADAAERSRISELFGAFKAGSVSLDELAKQAFKDPNPITRRLAFGELLASMTPENAAELREKLLAYGARETEWNDFNYSWGAMAGREALEVAAASKEDDLSAVMSGWAAANPTEAMALLTNLPENMVNYRSQIAEALVAGLADTDTSLATSLALRLAQEGTGRADRMIVGIASEVLRMQGGAAASVWASGLPDGAAKGAAMSRIAGDFAREDAQAAAKWVEGFASDSFASRAVAEVGTELGRQDPDMAVNWLESLPAGPGQSEGFRNVMGDWEDTNPQAASAYLAGMPQSPQRDAAISGFASGYAWQNPKASIEWAQDISDPSLRQRTLIRAGQAYYNREPEAARAWLESSGLPAESRWQVLNR